MKVGNTPMNDRDLEARPGDDYQTEIEGEPLDEPSEAQRLVMPRKADVARSDQARRMQPSHTSATPAGPDVLTPARSQKVAQARQVVEPEPAVQVRQVVEPAAAPIRLKSPHPLSRLRREGSGRGKAVSFGLGGLAAPRLGAARPGASRVGRPRLGRPSLRGIFGFAGLTATVAVVTGLLVTLPSQSTTPAATGSVYGINWHAVVKPPTSKLDFGPYFTTLGNQLLMLGTVNSTTTEGTVSSTTTVWASSDGSTWSQQSGSGAFSIDGRRFVAQGLSDDGQGGLVAIGNSLGSAPTDVVATAWQSRDGKSWTQMQVDSGGGQEMIAGVASRPGAVVAAGNGVAWLSTDGRTWTPQVLPGASVSGGSYTPRGVGSWSGGFVIIGLWNGDKTTRSTVWYSQTGRDWKQATTSLAGFDVRGIAAVGGTIVAVGIDLSANAPALAASWRSTDGGTWTKATAPTDLSTIAMDGVTNVGGSLVAFGAPAPGTTSPAADAGPTLPGSTPQPAPTEVVWVSENGVDWLPITGTVAPLNRAHTAAIGNRVVMIGGSGSGLGLVTGDLVLGPARPPATQSAPPAIFALTLQAANAPAIVDVTKDFTMGPVTTTKDRFFLFATGPAGTMVFSSPDGSLWSQEIGPDDLTASVVTPQPVASGASSQPAASGASPQPVASGSSPQPVASSAAPQAVVTGRPVVLQAIPDGQGGIIATGRVTNSSGNNGMIWHMKAGKWQQVQFQDDAPPEISSIAAGPDGFVASSDLGGGSQIMYSTDGDSWQASSIAVGSGFALTVATYRYGYVAVGADPARQGATTAWTSPDGRTWTLRTDWHLPPNVSALFGMGTTLVAAANSVPSASSASPATSAKPTPTPAVPVQSSTWWWSATGVVWQQSGLQTSGGDWAIANGRILVLTVPARSTGTWTAWSSSDGRSWQRPASSPVTFAGSQTCTIASLDSRLVVVGWESPGNLKDYFGRFDSH